MEIDKSRLSGRWRRLLALWVDFAVYALVVGVFTWIFSFFWPITSQASNLKVTVLPHLPALLVFLTTPLVFGTTLGKSLFDLKFKLVPERKRPGFFKWAGRMILIFFLSPVCALMVLLTKHRRHWGDMLAGTIVVNERQPSNILGSLALGAIFIFGAYFFSQHSTLLALKNSPIHQAAMEQLYQEYGEEAEAFEIQSLSFSGDLAQATYMNGLNFVIVPLRSSGNLWTAQPITDFSKMVKQVKTALPGQNQTDPSLAGLSKADLVAKAHFHLDLAGNENKHLTTAVQIQKILMANPELPLEAQVIEARIQQESVARFAENDRLDQLMPAINRLESQLQNILRKDPTNFLALTMMANVHVIRSEQTSLQEAMAKLRRSHPSHWRVLELESYIAYKIKDYNRAGRLLNQIVQLNQDPAVQGRAYASLFRVYRKANQPQLAEQAISKSLSLNYISPRIMGEYAELLSELKRHDEAIGMAKRALAVRDFVKGRMSLGGALYAKGEWAFYQEGKTEEGFAWFTEALKQNPDLKKAHLGIASYYSEKITREPSSENYQQAKFYLESYQKLGGQDQAANKIQSWLQSNEHLGK